MAVGIGEPAPVLMLVTFLVPATFTLPMTAVPEMNPMRRATGTNSLPESGRLMIVGCPPVGSESFSACELIV